MATDDSTVVQTQPQTTQAVTVPDPSHIDGTAVFAYDVANNFVLKGYTTAIQDTQNTDTPANFPNDAPKTYAPTSAPFILQINGTGFAAPQGPEPFKVYAEIGGFVSIIPPLPSTGPVDFGHAYGYIIKSDTSLWIYFNRLLAQKVWMLVGSFTGKDNPNKVQIESGNASYPFISFPSFPSLTIHVAPNNGTLKFETGFFTQDTIIKSLQVSLTQSPFIITLKAQPKQDAVVPSLIATDDSFTRSVDLFGHALTSKKVLMVRTASTLLKDNPSAIPKDVLAADQSSLSIEGMDAQKLVTLEYFKVGNFLTDLKVVPLIGSAVPSNYNYFAADGVTVENTGPNGFLPEEDHIPRNRFNILTLPADKYNVVVYDEQTGAYSVAADQITFTAQLGGLQIHDVTPSLTTLHNPTFTINGFNFPTTDDIKAGAFFAIALTSVAAFGDVLGNPITPTASIALTSTSPSSDANGSITLSRSQVIARFTNLNFVPGPNDPSIVYLQASVIYPAQDPKIGQINDIQTSPAIHIQTPPSIAYLSNADTFANTGRSLVRVDQTTGQIIANAVPTNDLFIVGSNFGTGTGTQVFIGGVQQQIDSLLSWQLNNSLSAIKVKVNPANMKGDATVEVKVGGVSSEPFAFVHTFKVANTLSVPTGMIAKGKQTIQTDAFFFALPTNPFDGYTLLNSTNTKASASTPVEIVLSNTNSKQSINIGLNPDNIVPLTFLPNQITIPDKYPLNPDGTVSIAFNFFGIWNVNFSKPTIVKLLHAGVDIPNKPFNPGDTMTVVGTGFVNGMRYNINETGWKAVGTLGTIELDHILYQDFEVTVPDPNGKVKATIRVSSDQAADVSSIHAAGLQHGTQKLNILINSKYSPLLQTKQRLPGGNTMSAKGTHNTMTDRIDANMSIYTQMTPFLASFKIILIVIRTIVCIIDCICALINPFSLVIAIIALMDCVIELLSLFPQLAVPIMIVSFLQNFIGFLPTFIERVETQAFGIVNSQLALLRTKRSKHFSGLAAAEQQCFHSTKQMRDVVAYLEPPLQIIAVFRDLLNFAMHFPCAGSQGTSQAAGNCPPANIQNLIDAADDSSFVAGEIERLNAIPFFDDGGDAPKATLATMFCQAMAVQTATLQTMPGFNGRDSFGNPLANGGLAAGSTAVVPNATPILPNVAATLECMNLLTAEVENALNNGEVFVTSPEQGQELVAAFLQCIQNLLDQSNQSLNDMCVLAVSAINSEIRVSPKGSIAPDLTDDFVKTKIPLPTTQPNDQQDAGLTLDLAKLTDPSKVPMLITKDPNSSNVDSAQNFGSTRDIYTPVIIQTTNKSGQRQGIDTLYFNADNTDVGTLIVPGDIAEIVGGKFSGLQFPITAVQQIFTAVRLTCKLDLTPEQKRQVGDQPLPIDLSGFDVKVVAHLAGNDAVAVIPADNVSVATIQIFARDHHGHSVGTGLANKVSINIEKGDAVFVPFIPSSTTDITGVVKEDGDHYSAQLKSECAGIVIISAAVCGIEFKDIGYFAHDVHHAITTRKKTAKIVFTPSIPRPVPGNFEALGKPQVPGSHTPN